MSDICGTTISTPPAVVSSPAEVSSRSVGGVIISFEKRERINARQREWRKRKAEKEGRAFRIVRRSNTRTPEIIRQQQIDGAARYNLRHPGRVRQIQRESKRRMLLRLQKYNTAAYEAYRTFKREYAKRYRAKHRDRINREKVVYTLARRKSDPEFKIQCLISSRIRSAIKRANAKKCASSAKLLGCTIQEARNHIESLFKDGMNWDAFMRGEIHLDHILPVSLFDMNDPEQQKVCFCIRNYQPLWGPENLTKNDRLPNGISIRTMRSQVSPEKMKEIIHKFLLTQS